VTALLVEPPAWGVPCTLHVDGTARAFGAWTPVAPGTVRVELRPRLAGPGLLVVGTLRLDHEVDAGTSVRLRLG